MVKLIHVHLVLSPGREESLEVLLRRVHGRYAQMVNAKRLPVRAGLARPGRALRMGKRGDSPRGSCVTVAPSRLSGLIANQEIGVPRRAAVLLAPKTPSACFRAPILCMDIGIGVGAVG